MAIQYIEPLSGAWGRMKRALFQPFDIRKWFVVGFTAFLAQLTDCRGGNGGGGGQFKDRSANWDEVMELPGRISEWLMENPAWAMFIAVAAVLLIVLLVLATWVSSRGKFMFLDNVVHDRAQVAAPWSAYRSEGNSLFLWRLSFAIIALLIVGGYLIESFFTLYSLYEQDGNGSMLLGPVLWRVLAFFLMIAVVAVVDLFLSGFVVPIMYRDRLRVLDAWSRFYRLFTANPWEFIGYALFVLVLWIPVIIGVILFGCLTCCCGFLILAIPYISDVLLLPLWYTYRAFSVEFLEQFGPDYRIFPRIEPVQPPDSPPSFDNPPAF